MQTSFRTTLSPADIGRMIGGALLMLLTLPALIAAPFWVAALAVGSNRGGLAGLPLLAFVSDTFHADLDEIIAAFRRVAPEAVELDLVDYRPAVPRRCSPTTEGLMVTAE